MNCSEKLLVNQCRTCYNATKGLRLLTKVTKYGSKYKQKSYAELVTEITNINIMAGSYKEFPQFICDCCLRKLKVAHTFIQQTHEVHERLIAMIAIQEEANKHLDCLQESQVDIQSCLEIKMEHDNFIAVDEGNGNCNLELEMEETKEVLQSNLLQDVDVLCARNNAQEVDMAEEAGLEKKESNSSYNMNDNENINGKDIYETIPASETEIKSKFKPFSDLLQLETNERSNDIADNDQGPDIQWQRDEENKSQIGRKKDEIFLKKFEKVAEKHSAGDDDVAVPCSQCSKIFNNSKALLRHQRTSHIPEDQKCTCPLCFRKFSRSCNMYTHMRTFHGPDTVPLIRKPSTQERIFQCDKCSRNYTKKKHLNIHIKNKHSQENESSKKSKEAKNVTSYGTCPKANKAKRYEVRSLCSICGSSFSSKTHLIVHMRRHTGERPFKCDLCDRAYPRISELTCHRRIHTGEKPFACKICGKTFRVSSKMTTHMRSHTDIRPYKCTQCERSFKYSKDLSIHFRIHTGERPYSCHICGSTFTQSNTLKAHRIKLGHMDNVNNLV